jgi:hypothetical protein
MSHALKLAGRVAVTSAAGGVAIGGSAVIIPLAPVLIAGGILAGTVVMVSYLNNSRKKKEAKYRGMLPAPKVMKVKIKGGDDRFFIQSWTGEYCSIEINSSLHLTCNRKSAQEWETFRIMRADDGRVAFQGANQRFVSVDDDKGGLLVANRDDITDSNLFTMEERDDSFVTLKSRNGKFVSRQADQNTFLKASSDSARQQELFRFMVMKDQINFTETINVRKTISVNIDIHNYKEVVKHHKGWFQGSIINNVSILAKSAQKEIRDEVTRQLTEKLRSQIEEAVNAELSNRLGKEISTKITEELSLEKIDATVVTSVQ